MLILSAAVNTVPGKFVATLIAIRCRPTRISPNTDDALELDDAAKSWWLWLVGIRTTWEFELEAPDIEAYPDIFRKQDNVCATEPEPAEEGYARLLMDESAPSTTGITLPQPGGQLKLIAIFRTVMVLPCESR